MTINDSANLPADGGSKTVEPSDIDNPSALNFWEPEEEQANPEQSGDGIADETGAAEYEIDSQETDATAGDENEEDDDIGNENAGADAELDETLVTLKGGEQVPVKELKLGYMRERDYRLKTQETANRGRELESLSTRVVNTANAFAQFLASQLPPEPSHDLAIQNPNEYTRQKAIFDNAMGRVNQILQMGAEPQAVVQRLTGEQRNEMLKQESENLVEAFPQTAKPEEREKFFEEAFDTARQLGFSDEEMAEVTDHRYFKLAHYARLGMQAEAAKKKAFAKVNNAPPAAPARKAQGQNAQQSRKNKDAMEKLTRTGSLKDAMNIDF
ncbi:hypothetical protein [Agrobacterium sp. SUL3]|uniref:hypothetical protein n=1 Tax=Agrobacterium sp. SUL3 TaxID=1701910 RepID=UPI0006A3FB96|nr:hypothetical protein [Agrobacterium sp. SUL3]KNY35558.1 hypothetical protein AKG12_00480 [Agrobacterium sp. SUL3]